jgi:hypothetical protein
MDRDNGGSIRSADLTTDAGDLRCRRHGWTIMSTIQLHQTFRKAAGFPAA